MAMIATRDSASMRAVADHAGFGLAADQLGRGAARNQRVKSADGSAGNSDERERKNVSREHRAGAVDKARERRHVQRGTQDDDSQRQQRDGS